MFVNIIVVYEKNQGIGLNNSLPWKISSDLKKFKELTIGNKKNGIVMGKNTWLSLNNKSLQSSVILMSLGKVILFFSICLINSNIFLALKGGLPTNIS